MYVMKESKHLRWTVKVGGSKNAALPILAASYLVDKNIKLNNMPDIRDIQMLKKIANVAIKESSDFLDLTSEYVQKLRASILLIPWWLIKYWKVKFSSAWGCNLGKRPLDPFNNALKQAGIKLTYGEDYSFYEILRQPYKDISLMEFSVTTTEAVITYLAFATNYDYDIKINQIAIEPHVINLIDFLKWLWANITINYDHSVLIKPSKINTKMTEFDIIWDYLEAWLLFAIWAIAYDSEIIISWINPDELVPVLNTSRKIGIDFEVIDNNNIKVNSFNKANYKWVKLQTMIYPWFPTDLQSAFGALLTQVKGLSKIDETLFEGRFSYLAELEKLWANVELLNPHKVLIIWPSKLHWAYISSTDIRWWWALLLAWTIAQWTTHILNEEIIERGHEKVIEKLSGIGVDIINPT